MTDRQVALFLAFIAVAFVTKAIPLIFTGAL
jgi:hypothetical protein